MYSFSSFLVPYRVLAATICTQDVREFGESAKTCLINHELSMFGPVLCLEVGSDLTISYRSTDMT